jgi:hypothetical protein
MRSTLVAALFSIGLSGLSAVAFAEGPQSYDGTWKAEFVGRAGATRDGKVVIQGTTGSWDMAVRVRNDPCQGRAYPITVTSATDSELVFRIERAATLAGCKDGKASLRRVDERTLEGQFDGFKLRMLRD